MPSSNIAPASKSSARRQKLCAALTRLLSLGTNPGMFFFVGRSGSLRLSGPQKALGRLSPMGLFLERKKAVTALFHEEIARRRKEPSPTKDVLSLLLDLSDEQWDRTLGINLGGSFVLGQAAARTMVRDGASGRIVFVSSINGIAS